MHFNSHQLLRLARKKSGLSLSDMEALLGMPNTRNLSHYERGRRTWSIEMMMIYHLIFDLDFNILFENTRAEIKKILATRVSQLLVQLQFEEPTPKRVKRKEYLESTLFNLTQPTSYEL